jgi:hypothetical protein
MWIGAGLATALAALSEKAARTTALASATATVLYLDAREVIKTLLRPS